ncbi:helix-turn-helix domain-containing protein [Candidatus Albibeggiatoa sp. nov. NOAA]|uniref:helix-turn-helix domain-containing protein n=1 Tax=Candidatus Albibeggiatoa sp. nov. NOAA TaxID=3162724 RepID=UPI003302EFDE|nr:helix-turn-helix domain containing protein [Thiotrichaceae bacterium]
MSIKYRLNQVVDQQDRTLKSISEQLDISYRTLQNYLLEERTNISIDLLKSFHTHFGVNIHWLVTGEGEMFLNEEQKAQDADDILQNLTSEQRQEIITRTQEMQLMNDMKQRLEAVESTLTEITQLKSS